MCDTCVTRVNTTVLVVYFWDVRVMGVYAGGGYRTYNNSYNQRGVQHIYRKYIRKTHGEREDMK